MSDNQKSAISSNAEHTAAKLAEFKKRADVEPADIPGTVNYALQEFAVLPVTGSNQRDAAVSTMADVNALLDSIAVSGLDERMLNNKGILTPKDDSRISMSPLEPDEMLACASESGIDVGVFLTKENAEGAERDSYLMLVNNHHTQKAIITGDVDVAEDVVASLDKQGVTYVNRKAEGAAEKIADSYAQVLEGAVSDSLREPVGCSVALAFHRLNIDVDLGEGIVNHRDGNHFVAAQVPGILADAKGELASTERKVAAFITDGPEFDTVRNKEAWRNAKKDVQIAEFDEPSIAGEHGDIESLTLAAQEKSAAAQK